MTWVAGVDGAKDGWAAVLTDGADSWRVKRLGAVAELLDTSMSPQIVAIDIPIGLLDTYCAGGRECDRQVRAALSPYRSSSVFPAPIRPTLPAESYHEALAISRASALHAKGLSKQAFALLTKIREIDDLLKRPSTARHRIREVHPEYFFAMMAGEPMRMRKRDPAGQRARISALQRHFPSIDQIIEIGRRERLHSIDVLDACAACRSARRIIENQAVQIPPHASVDGNGLPMTIWG